MTRRAESRGSWPRQLVQRLESLQRAGVGQLAKREVKRGVRTKKAAAAKVRAPAADPKAGPARSTPKPALPLAGGASLSPADRGSALDALAAKVASCEACHELCTTRTQTVFGVGNPAARLCLFGEAPGADEDRLGEPFVGRAGQLLDRILAACTLKREDIYILNVLKCRPPGNRNPSPEEVANCRPFFERQLEIIQPEFICCLGSVAASNLLETKESIGKLRGRFHDWKGIPVLATYHPAYLLRNPPAKAEVWKDMQFLMREMGIELPRQADA